MTDMETLSVAVAKCHSVISFLGPARLKVNSNAEFAGHYSGLFQLMRQHGVRRIFAMGTISIVQPGDHFSFMRHFIVLMVRLLAPGAYRNIMAIQKLFEDENETRDIDWTVYRLGLILGDTEEKTWKTTREDAEMYVGPIGGPGWQAWQQRGALVRWLVDAAESGAPELIHTMPAVSQLKGRKSKTA